VRAVLVREEVKKFVNLLGTRSRGRGANVKTTRAQAARSLRRELVWNESVFFAMSREFMFENEHAICWKTTVPPNLPLKMHRHDRARTIVALQGGVLKRVDEDGSRMDLVFKTGQAYWYEADPPDNLHADVNEGHEDVIVIVTEFKTEEDRNGTRNARDECGCGVGPDGKCDCKSKIGLPFKMPAGWEPPTSKRAAAE